MAYLLRMTFFVVISRETAGATASFRGSQVENSLIISHHLFLSVLKVVLFYNNGIITLVAETHHSTAFKGNCVLNEKAKPTDLLFSLIVHISLKFELIHANSDVYYGYKVSNACYG